MSMVAVNFLAKSLRFCVTSSIILEFSISVIQNASLETERETERERKRETDREEEGIAQCYTID